MVTVFIGTFNRLGTLERTVRSYRKFRVPHELVIVDNGSDDPESLALLDRLDVKKVYHLSGCDSMEEATDNFNVAVRDQYDGTGGDWFAISEADVCFEGTSRAALSAYITLAKKTGCAVGPHTRVDASIPRSYPLRSRVLATESRLLYANSMTWHKNTPHSPWPIDTTFHLFPRTREFRRLKMNTLRCGPPYDAKHLDWYLDIFKPNRENEIYMAGPSHIGGWGKSWVSEFWNNFQLDREMALDVLMRAERTHTDLCNNSFIISWCHQYGMGTPVDEQASMHWLNGAIPWDTVWTDFREDWLRMIYRDDFSCLGWG